MLISALLLAQDKSFGIRFSGFVKTDFFYDTRQTVNLREGHFLLYPQNESPDVAGADLNAAPGFNILSIQTRLTAAITGPDAFGAKTSGMVEGAFFGQSEPDINGFRLRHAFVKLNWEKSELLMGQFWHPMFIHDAFPAVVSFNTGAPFQPFSRNPQVRFGYTMSKFKLILTALGQRDFASTGPSGGSSVYLRNAAIPEVNAQLQFKRISETGNEFMAGISGSYKQLTPRISNTNNVKVDESVQGFSGLFFTKYSNSALTAKLEGVYGQNLYDLTMLGGYAVKFDDDTANLRLDMREYTTLDVMSVWLDVHTNGVKIQPGFFAGYTQNLGSTNNIRDWGKNDFYYARGNNIKYLYRVAPRLSFISGKMRLALELEYTTAAYGSTRNSLGQVENSKKAGNLRALFSAIYLF